MISGKLIFWSDKRNFGYIEVQVRENGGIYLTKYFLHRTNVSFTTSEDPKAGSTVVFDVDSTKPASNRFPLALNAMIFDTAEQAEFYATTAKETK